MAYTDWDSRTGERVTIEETPEEEAARLQRESEEFTASIRATWQAILAGDPCSDDFKKWLAWKFPELAPKQYRWYPAPQKIRARLQALEAA